MILERPTELVLTRGADQRCGTPSRLAPAPTGKLAAKHPLAAVPVAQCLRDNCPAGASLGHSPTRDRVPACAHAGPVFEPGETPCSQWDSAGTKVDRQRRVPTTNTGDLPRAATSASRLSPPPDTVGARRFDHGARDHGATARRG